MEYVTLSNGVKMPQIGYGVYQVSKDECERCVLDALSVGYRHIDTAQSYFNEEEVGEAIAKSGVPRSEIFLTTKVWVEHYGYDETRESVLESMRKLKTNYIDLVLLHQPFADVYGAWRALEDLYAEGVIKAIGVSNFGRSKRTNGWSSTAYSMRRGRRSAKAEAVCLRSRCLWKSARNTARHRRRSFSAGSCSAGLWSSRNRFTRSGWSRISMCSTSRSRTTI